MKPVAIFVCALAFVAIDRGSAFAGTFGSFAVSDRLAPAFARVTVSLPLRNEPELEALVHAQSDPASPEYQHFISPAQFRARYGPDSATLRAVMASLRADGLHVDEISTQSVHVSGSARAMARAFGTTVQARRFAREPAARFVATSVMHPSPILTQAGATVIGLEAIPAHRRFSERARMPLSRISAEGSYWFTDLKEAYSYPAYSVANGSGATIGIVMSNDVLNTDLNGIFNHEKFSVISGAKNPVITRHRVDGGAPFNEDLSLEPTLDVQRSLGSAPGANLILYNTLDLSDQSIIDGYTAVVDQNVADVISSSFGLCELFYTPGYNDGQDFTNVLKAERQLFLQGNAQGQTFVASSGDNAGLPCPTVDYFNGITSVYVPGVSDPASDPSVTAVGGTNLVTTIPPSPQPSPESLTSNYVRESEYADPLIAEDPYGVGANLTNGYFGSGSGVSAIWKRPAEQQPVVYGVKYRSVPDISMEMGGCPSDATSCGPDDSASIIEIGGQFTAVIGTSSSSPEFAGLLAVRIGSLKHRLGNVNPAIYTIALGNAQSPYPLLHNAIGGYNGVVSVLPKPMLYSPINGVGTPITKNILGLPSAVSAGDPQTTTNP